jgi:hypothetical protein
MGEFWLANSKLHRTHQPHLRRSDKQNEALGKQRHSE